MKPCHQDMIEKPINKGSFQSAITSVWGIDKDLKFEEVGKKLFQVFFDDE